MNLSGSHSTVRLLNISKAAILITKIGINAFQVKLTDQADVIDVLENFLTLALFATNLSMNNSLS
jgi:hypothetical protein